MVWLSGLLFGLSMAGRSSITFQMLSCPDLDHCSACTGCSPWVLLAPVTKKENDPVTWVQPRNLR